MMKNRSEWPPGGWQFVQPEGPTEIMGLSFNETVKALIGFRVANPGLVKKHQWATDFKTVADEVDAYNDFRCRAHGWMGYVTSHPNPSFSPAAFHSPPPRPASAVESIKRVRAGARTLLDWVGSGGKPVDQKIAEVRASICAGCEKNGKGGWEHYFTVPAAAAIKLQLEIRNDLKLATSYDDRLNVCEACLCPLRLKVFCPIEHINKEMDLATKEKLWSGCWILREQ